MIKTLDFIISGSDVKRYHTVSTISTETVGHHSHGVALLTALICPFASRRVLLAALLHDLAECETGDIPSPAKRRMNLNEQVSQFEETVLRQHDLVMPYLSDEEKRILKLADIAHGALFCLKEMQMGNSKLREVFERYIAYSSEIEPVENSEQLFNIIMEKSNECK